MRAVNYSLTTRASSRHVSFDELLRKGVLYTAIIHSIACFIITLFGYCIDLKFLYALISGTPVMNDGNFVKYFLQFISYNLALTFLAVLFGKLLRHIIFRFELHVRFTALYNINYWFEIFNGLNLQRPGVPGSVEETDIIAVDILTADDRLYQGFIRSFYYDPHKDCLESIVLANVRTKKLGAKTFKNIPGDYMVFLASTIKNLNIFYIELKDLKTDNLPEAGQQ